jgi:hypothetical protein
MVQPTAARLTRMGEASGYRSLADWPRSRAVQARLHENDIEGELLRGLTDDDLKDIGIASLGHRRKLLQAIEVLTAAPRLVALQCRPILRMPILQASVTLSADN